VKTRTELDNPYAIVSLMGLYSSLPTQHILNQCHVVYTKVINDTTQLRVKIAFFCGASNILPPVTALY
jgi:hypothetical protein